MIHFKAFCNIFLLANILLWACDKPEPLEEDDEHVLSNILDYTCSPDSAEDRSSLVYSDQGAWFGYGIPDALNESVGFSGPYLLTQQNGVWSSDILSGLKIKLNQSDKAINFRDFKKVHNAYPSHLNFKCSNDIISIDQSLFYSDSYTALIKCSLKNISKEELNIESWISGNSWGESLRFKKDEFGINITSALSEAEGKIRVFSEKDQVWEVNDTAYSVHMTNSILKPNEEHTFYLAHSFYFPDRINTLAWYQWQYDDIKTRYSRLFTNRIKGKYDQLIHLLNLIDQKNYQATYPIILQKSILTLQNNWRSPAGEIDYHGLFPSYHKHWFNGFWAWDSWKHAAALAFIDTGLAKEQIRLMYSFQEANGFIPDCVFRDTSIEKHNYRDTKPPLSAWAVWKIYEQDGDSSFLEEMYYKISIQHLWWYRYRDHDKDGICEYGSTDGSLIAAKWESGMDNAVRFDNSKIVQNSAGAYSLDQESVDLNSYLYAEKMYLSRMAEIMDRKVDLNRFIRDANNLKISIQKQFYDEKTGWFYDTNLSGDSFISVMGCEGWIPLWAQVATESQADAVMKNIMDETLFNTFVPLPTLSASHTAFEPAGGYWRGPVWLDQAYFGIRGLLNYSYPGEARMLKDKLISNCERLNDKGQSIRENYNPQTGQGLEAENFSWSAAHLILLLMDE